MPLRTMLERARLPHVQQRAGGLLFLLLLPFVLGISGVRTPLVERISFTERSGTWIVRIHASEAFSAYSAPRVRDGQVEVVLFNTSLARGYRAEDPAGPVRTYATRLDGGHLVLRFELLTTVEASAYHDRDSNDLLLALKPNGRIPANARREPPRSEAPGAPPTLGQMLPPEQPVTAATPTTNSRWTLDTIVLDAGHGGHDTGAAGNGVREKDITLGVTLKLGRYLQEQLGVKVVYTRRDDRFITLRDRGKLANEAGGKLFISIHVNSAPGGRSARGTETFFLGLHRNAAAQAVMERENSVVRLEEDPSVYANFNDESLILRTMANSLYLRKSERLAGMIEAQFSERVGRTSRGVKQAGFLVLWGASMPAVLVETGFITNAEEAAFLASERGQDLMASAIFRAVRAFKEEYEHDLEVGAR